MSGTGGQIDSNGVLHDVAESPVADRCHAAWVIAGLAARDWAGPATDHVPAPVKDAAHEVLSMLDVATPDALRDKPRRRVRRRVVRKHV